MYLPWICPCTTNPSRFRKFSEYFETDVWYHFGYTSATLYYFYMNSVCADSLLDVDVEYTYIFGITTSIDEATMDLSVYD